MRNKISVFVAGVVIGILGGLIGLGGAEFRLPLLISIFGFSALDAVILNKAMSLIVVASALVFRTKSVPLDVLLVHWTIVVNLLAGSLLGAWLGASWATRLATKLLYRLISVLLVFIAVVLVLGHDTKGVSEALLTGSPQVVAGVVAGFSIGVVASLMGVAGGELLIPTLVLLFGVGIKTAGSLSLSVSLPTMISGFARYSLDQSFSVFGRNKSFVVVLAFGSIVGSFIGSRLLDVVPNTLLLPVLALILVISSVKVWRHE